MEQLKNEYQFDFSDEVRCSLFQKKYKLQYTKTGTTICGLVFKDGVVIAADTRSTGGNIVADRNCPKVHYISENIRCCGAGTAADNDAVTNMVRDQLKLLQMKIGRQPPVSVAAHILINHLFRYQGHVSAYLILGGVDALGKHLFSITAHGSFDKMPYATLGSGSLAAQQVLDTEYRPDMSEEEAIQIAAKAIESGIINDLGSGSNVDVCVITKEGARVTRSFKKTGTESAQHGEKFQ